MAARVLPPVHLACLGIASSLATAGSRPNLPWPPFPFPATAGFVLLRDTQPDAGPVEYLFQEDKPAAAAAPAAPAEPAVPAAPDAAPVGDEPPPPEPFEYIPS